MKTFRVLTGLLLAVSLAAPLQAKPTEAEPAANPELRAQLQQAEQNLAEQEVKLRKEEEKVTKFKREDSGLRFTITCLVAFTVFQAGLLIWIATHR